MLKYRSQKEQMMNFVKKHENYFCSVDRVEDGIKTGENYFATLTEKLLKDSRIDDLGRATSDLKFRNALYKEYHINREMDLK